MSMKAHPGLTLWEQVLLHRSEALPLSQWTWCREGGGGMPWWQLPQEAEPVVRVPATLAINCYVANRPKT